jgi:hypothetical protein
VQGAPACVTVKVCPPAVIVPVRPVVLGFAPTPKLTVPGPMPSAPAVMVIQAALLVAVQAQPSRAVSATAAAPPAAATN